MDTLTTADAAIPEGGRALICTASTACPTTILGVDEAEAERMMLLHTVQHRTHQTKETRNA
jgi:hypothetical protein